MTIAIKREGGKVYVDAPYHKDFVARARALGGKWTKPDWVFDPRDEARVEEALKDVYKWRKPVAGEPVVTVEVTVSADHDWKEHRAPLLLGGVCVASAFGRDSGARLGENVVVTKGTITSGGSMKNWNTVAKAKTVFEIRDIPQSTAEAILETTARGYSYTSARTIDDGGAERRPAPSGRCDIDAITLGAVERWAGAAQRAIDEGRWDSTLDAMDRDLREQCSALSLFAGATQSEAEQHEALFRDAHGAAFLAVYAAMHVAKHGSAFAHLAQD